MFKSQKKSFSIILGAFGVNFYDWEKIFVDWLFMNWKN